MVLRGMTIQVSCLCEAGGGRFSFLFGTDSFASTFKNHCTHADVASILCHLNVTLLTTQAKVRLQTTNLVLCLREFRLAIMKG